MSSGTITLRRPRVRGVEERFESRVLPLFARRTKELGALLPELYLHGDVARGFSPLYEPLRVSVGHGSLIVLFATLPFRGWAARVQLDDPYIKEVLDFVDKLNGRLFDKYGSLIHGV